MEHCLIVIFTILTFASWATSELVVLMKTPDCNACVWSWYRFPVTPTGWSHSSDPNKPKTTYTLCNYDPVENQEPNNWLRSEIIAVGDVQRVDVTVKYFSHLCLASFSFCNESFAAYVWESNIRDQKIPDPINSFGSYRRFATINHQDANPSFLTIPLRVNSKFIVLGFRDQGGCRTLFSVKVTYDLCPKKSLNNNLVALPRTLAPSNDLESIPVNGSCTENSFQAVEGSLSVLCESTGEWNTSRLQGRCVCKENMENNGGICGACSHGTFNDEKGLSCTVLPSEPRAASVPFVNQSSAVIIWSSPAITGTQTHVLYDVECEKSCKYYGQDCDDETCNAMKKDSHAMKKEGLNMTKVIITNLPSFVNYTCKLIAKNRVSEVAERRHRVKANFTTVNLRTEGFVPGKPEVDVYLAEATTIALLWKLKCKNGGIKEFHVTYFRVDEISKSETLTTKETKVQIEGLTAGKTFEFQVVAVNNYGRGLAGVKTFKIPKGDLSAKSKAVIAGAAGGGALLLIIIGVIVIVIVFRFRRNVQNRCEQRINVQAIQGEIVHMNMDVVVVTDTADNMNGVQYMDIDEIHSFELKRDDIRFLRLLGSGTFGEVFKATIGNKTVAVKCLKETATAKDKHDMITELNVMKGLKPHPHVLKLIGCCSLSDPLLIVLEYLPYGDLLGYLRKSRGHSDRYNSGDKPTSRLTAKDLLSFAWMIADGMNYLAKMKIVHRDLAARNILVGENKVCKISDFGLARDVNVDIYVRSSQARLPVKWMPPESLFLGESSTMSDVWSYGIVLWEVFTIGNSPYPGVKGREVASLLERGYRMPRPVHIGDELFSIMSECWSEKPEARPTFQWICGAMRRLMNDQKCYVNLDVYNDKDYINFDMFDELQ